MAEAGEHEWAEATLKSPGPHCPEHQKQLLLFLKREIGYSEFPEEDAEHILQRSGEVYNLKISKQGKEVLLQRGNLEFKYNDPENGTEVQVSIEVLDTEGTFVETASTYASVSDFEHISPTEYSSTCADSISNEAPENQSPARKNPTPAISRASRVTDEVKEDGKILLLIGYIPPQALPKDVEQSLENSGYHPENVRVLASSSRRDFLQAYALFSHAEAAQLLAKSRKPIRCLENRLKFKTAVRTKSQIDNKSTYSETIWSPLSSITSTVESEHVLRSKNANKTWVSSRNIEPPPMPPRDRENTFQRVKDWAMAPKMEEMQKTVQVRGNFNSNLLRLYLENGARSKGGKILDMDVHEDLKWATVTFEDSGAALGVLEHPSHILEDQPIYISLLPPLSEEIMFLKSIPDWVGLDTLKNYMEARSKVYVKEIIFKEDNTGALVFFEDSVDYMQLVNAIKERPLKDGEKIVKNTDLTVSRVFYPDALILNDVPETLHTDNIIMTFENILEQKGPPKIMVKHVHRYKDTDQALVILDNYRGVPFIGSSVKIDKVTVQCKPYCDLIGIAKETKGSTFLREHKNASVTKKLNGQVIRILNTRKGKELVNDQLEAVGLQCYWEVNEEAKTVTATAKTSSSSAQSVNEIVDCVSNAVIEIDAAQVKVVASREWERFVKTVLTEHEDAAEITLAEKQISIFALANEIQKLRKKVKEFIEAKAEYEANVVSDKEFALYLKDYAPKIMNKYEVKYNAASKAIVAKGTSEQLELITEDIQNVLQQITKEEYTVTKPGMPTFLKSIDGRHRIVLIQKESETVISEKNELYRVDKSSSETGNGASAGLQKSEELRGFVEKDEKRLRLVVKSGDITLEPADVIVNAANNELDHYGGLAKAIANAGGQEIQAECKNFIKENGNLAEGGVFMGSPGTLSCKAIAHAVGPTWRGGNDNESDRLRNAIVLCLVAADSNGYSSIAIPGISTGIFRYPLKNAVRVIVSAILDTCFSNQGTNTIKEVVLIDSQSDAVTAFMEEVRKIPEFKEEEMTSNAEEARPLPTISTVPKESKIKRRSRQNLSSISNNIIFPNGAQVSLKQGDMANEALSGNFDAVVNSTSNDILAGGTTCQILLTAGGQPLIDAVKTTCPQGIGTACSAVATEAGNLKVKNVIHVVLPNFDRNNASERIRSAVGSCIQIAASHQIQSIAFPAIGTGGLNYPADVSATNLLEEIKSNKNAANMKITVVLLPTDQPNVQGFQNIFNRYSAQSGVWQAQASVEGNSDSEGEDESFVDAEEMLSSDDEDHGEDAVIIGNVKVEVILGDLTNERTKCVLCPSSADRTLNHGQVEQALIAEGGSSFRMYYDAPQLATDLRKEGIAITNAGDKLPMDNVAFVHAPSHLKDWADYLMKVFVKLNNAGCASLSLPAIGTGVLHQNPREVAKLVLTTIQKFVDQTNPQNLTTIRIVIHTSQKNYFELFKQAVSAMASGSSDKGLLRKTWEKWFGSSTERKVHLTSAEKPLQLLIIGEQRNIEMAKGQLDKLCAEKCPDKYVRHDELRHYNESQIRELEAIANDYGVQFQFDSRDTVKITGFRGTEFETHLRTILQEQKQKKDTPLMGRWFSQDQNTKEWNKVSSEECRNLEYHWKENGGKGKCKISMGETERIVDFKKMTISKDNIKLKLKRKTISDVTPVEWEHGDHILKDGFKMVTVTPGSNEYNVIEAGVLASAPGTVIKQIKRVENTSLYKKWHVEYERMMLANGGRDPVRLLYHGTNDKNTNHICSEGFNRSYAGVNGTVHGHGSYFHKLFQYSARYGNPVFLAKVLTGDYVTGNSQLKDAPLKQGSTHFRYDSTVDDDKNPSIFVIYKDVNAYPAYAIYF